MSLQPHPTTRPHLHLLIANIGKRNNIRSLLLSAAAFECETILIAGQPKFDPDPTGPDIPRQIRPLLMDGTVRIVHFPKLEACVEYIRRELPISTRIVGVEIMETAEDVEDGPFRNPGDTVLMMGNEGSGMNKKQIEICDGFVKIRQYGAGTASLNVNVAANIVMHRFQTWARGGL